MIVDKYIEVSVGKNRTKYEQLGYEIPTYVDGNGRVSVKRGTKIKIKIEDLPKESHEKINAVCDCCGKETYVTYQSYNKSVDNYGEYACSKCRTVHVKKTINEKYDVDNISQIDDVKRKKKDKALEKYGVENVAQSAEIIEKIKKTNLEKYGETSYTRTDEYLEKKKNTILDKYGSFENFYKENLEKQIETTRKNYGVDWYTETDEYKERYKQTCLEKYGQEHASRSPEVIQKILSTKEEIYGKDYYKSEEFKKKFTTTNLKNLGVEYPTQSPIVMEKQRETMFRNGTVPLSRQQIYLKNLLGGELNYPFMRYSLDIFQKATSIVIEYSGSGHKLSVRNKNITEQGFEQKQAVRTKCILNAGYKLIEIISAKDYLPSDESLLEIYNLSKKYFDEGVSKIVFDIDNNIYIIDDNINTYDYGVLRKIREKDIMQNGGELIVSN